MHRRVITEHFDPQKTRGLWLVVVHFYGLKQILTAISVQGIQLRRGGAFVFLEREFGLLDLIVEKKHLNNPSVGSISLHNLGTFVTFV